MWFSEVKVHFLPEKKNRANRAERFLSKWGEKGPIPVKIKTGSLIKLY